MNTPTEQAGAFGSLTPATVIPARKPDPGWFVRVRPGEGWQTTIATVDLWGRGLYFVASDLAEGLPGTEFTQLFTTINHEGVVFFWPVSVTALMGRPRRRRAWLPQWPAEALAERPRDAAAFDRWDPAMKDARPRALRIAISERRAVWTAEQRWVGILRERYGCYLSYDYDWAASVPGMAAPPLPDLAWPALSFQELFDITFKDRCIYSFDDPIVEDVLLQEYGDPRYRPKPPPWPPTGSSQSR